MTDYYKTSYISGLIKMQPSIELFFKSDSYAVIGASTNRDKFGNKVLRCYQQNNKTVYPVHPVETEIEGINCYKSVNELPNDVKSISIITPPNLTEKIVDQAHAKGITNIWMQPGAQSDLAIQKCYDYGINVIADGSCILVVLGFPDH